MVEARVIRRSVEREDLVGTLFHPTSPGPHPALILLGGLEGGLMEGSAQRLASEGYAALALAYFGVEGLPRELVEVPLEYFAEAISWLKDQPMVDPERAAVVGISKGGELALLLGATYPEDVHAVVGYSPSAVVWRGVSLRPKSFFGKSRSSWTLEGEPVPFVDLKLRFSEVIGPFVGKLPSARAIYERSLEDEPAVAAGSVAVERIGGPVLLISYTDDRVWPSTRLSEMAMRRLAAYGHPFPFEHLRYEGAGHPIGLPYSAPVVVRVGLAPLGGNLRVNGFAAADSWLKMLGFLEKHLK